MASRLLFIISLVLAFAQPYWKSNQDAKSGIQVTAIYVDNSYSMTAQGTEGSLFSECREIAKNIVNKSHSRTRFFICTNALSGLERTMHTKATAIQFLDQIQQNRTPRTLETVLNFQAEYLRRYHSENASISKVDQFILSDFQKSSFKINQFSPKFDLFATKFHLVKAIAQKTENRFIDSVWTETPVHKPGDQVKFWFRVHNYGEQKAENVPITLLLEGKKRMTNLTIDANASANSYFTVSPTTSGYLEGKISLSDPIITWDDDFYFTHHNAASAKVLILQGEIALNNAWKVFQTEPYYQASTIPSQSFKARDLKYNDLLILNELNSIPSGLSESVKQFVQQGGSVFIIPSNESNIPEYNELLRSLQLGTFNGKAQQGNQVAELSYKSMFFRNMFEKEKNDLNLPLIQSVYAQRSANQSNAEVLIKLRNNLPLLVHQRTNGNVFLFTASPAQSNGGYYRHALYPSMLLRAAELSIRALPSSFVLGNSSSFAIEYEGNSDQPIKLTQNEESYVPKQMQQGTMVYVQLNTPELLERMKEGIYTVKGNVELAKIGINLNRDESIPTYIPKEDIMDAFEAKGIKEVSFQTMDQGANSLDVEIDKPSSFWEIFVILALLFLLLEMAILKFLLP